MTGTGTQQLIKLFQDAEVGWVFEQDPEGTAARVLSEIRDTEDVLRASRMEPVQPSLLDEMFREGFRPLVQAFASPMSARIRAMVYCILTGGEVVSLEYRFQRRKRSSLKVEVEMPSGELITFRSRQFWDFEVLRHLGMMKADGQPVIDGYYPFRYGP